MTTGYLTSSTALALGSLGSSSSAEALAYRGSVLDPLCRRTSGREIESAE